MLEGKLVLKLNIREKRKAAHEEQTAVSSGYRESGSAGAQSCIAHRAIYDMLELTRRDDRVPSATVFPELQEPGMDGSKGLLTVLLILIEVVRKLRRKSEYCCQDGAPI